MYIKNFKGSIDNRNNNKMKQVETTPIRSMYNLYEENYRAIQKSYRSGIKLDLK